MFLHRFEEYRYPGYFPGMVNSTMFSSKQLDRYPLNANTALIVNVMVGWLFYFIYWLIYNRSRSGPQLTSAQTFARFKLPITWWLGWIKNQPREVSFDKSEFFKSPDCKNPGEYMYKSMFDREFLNVVRLISFYRKMDNVGLLKDTQLEKYHRVTFNAGKTINILQSPDGTRYIRINRDANCTTDIPSLLGNLGMCLKLNNTNMLCSDPPEHTRLRTLAHAA